MPFTLTPQLNGVRLFIKLQLPAPDTAEIHMAAGNRNETNAFDEDKNSISPLNAIETEELRFPEFILRFLLVPHKP